MASLVIAVVVGGVVGLAGMTCGWYLGYKAGLEDGETGVSQVFPWSEHRRID